MRWMDQQWFEAREKADREAERHASDNQGVRVVAKMSGFVVQVRNRATPKAAR